MSCRAPHTPSAAGGRNATASGCVTSRLTEAGPATHEAPVPLERCSKSQPVCTGASLVACFAGLELPHALVEWVTMLRPARPDPRPDRSPPRDH